MLFNSFEFIFVFLPVVFVGYFYLNKQRKIVAANAWLVLSSLLFYSWWNVVYLPLILISLLFNYGVGSVLGKENPKLNRKAVFVTGILFNVGLLGYFKYSDFFISNVNAVFSTDFPLLHLALPLAISFFTFQQIAYLVDAYRYETKEYDFLNYALFVTFFPQLIAGPIVHHYEVVPQFKNLRNKALNYKNIVLGLFLFSIGLFKKIVIADTFAQWANKGFDELHVLTFIEGWTTSLSYTFQLYFDFSGYTDMAMGAALLFNIRLPINFHSPYKALNIQDFWRRWHMTLGRFLVKYAYIPLGGNRKGKARTYANIMIIFLVSGLWHGAGWTFVFWGFLHGLATVINRYWQTFNIRMNKAVAWLITFHFVNVAWVFFRAETWEDAIKVLKAMFGFNGMELPDLILWVLQAVFYIIVGFIMIITFKNSMEMVKRFRPNVLFLLISSVIFTYAVLHLNKTSEFLYFNF